MSEKIKFITKNEVLKKFNVSSRTLERRISDGSINEEFIKKINGTRFFNYDALSSIFTPKSQEKIFDDEPKPNDSNTSVKDDDLVTILKEQLAKAEERASKLEFELSESRKAYEELAKGAIISVHKFLEHQQSQPRGRLLSFFDRVTGRAKK